MNIPLTIEEKAELLDRLHEAFTGEVYEMGKDTLTFIEFTDNLLSDNYYRDDGKCQICGEPNH